MKRTVSIQDISCFGKCSLTVALPVLSAMGIETAIIPTAILSTHTGNFKGYTFCDLTGEIKPIFEHWKSLGLEFDSIYTGYLGSEKQVELVEEFFSAFGKGSMIFVDPVMGDKGVLYSGFDKSFPEKMARLCGYADIIVPNLTEATLLLGEEYKEGCDTEYIRSLLKRLTSRLGCKIAIVTGVIVDGEKHGAVAFDSRTGEYFEYFSEHIDAFFHGTGDVFSSSLCGALTLGADIGDAIKIAVDFTLSSIKATLPEKEKYWYAVNFEKNLAELASAAKKLGFLSEK